MPSEARRGSVYTLAIACFLGACASNNTDVVSTWKEPTPTPRRFNKVLVVFISKDFGLRKGAEDQLAKRLGNATPAYSAVADSILLNRDKAKAWVKRAGFDGAVVMRSAGVEQETTETPGQAYVIPDHYGSMWGYWGPGWDYAYAPGRVEQDQLLSVEANVYSVPEDKLVWSSRTTTKNPESVDQLVNEIVDVTVKEMKRQKAFASK